jgi:ABC-type antimicrobial peptide transport system permease subunit
MNIADLLFRYIKESSVESSLGAIGAAASIAVCLVAGSTRAIESDALAYQFAVSSMGFLTVAILLSLCMMSDLLLNRQEIGMLRALGAGKRIVMAIFLSKSILIGTLGSVAGIAVGCVFAAITHSVGQPYQSGELILRMLTVGSAGGVAGGLHVAIRASRINIMETIRG